MKFLHTAEFYSPSVGGAQEVIKQLSEHMVALGHDVTVATTKLPNRRKKVINGVKIKEFDISGNEVRGYTGKDVEKYKQFLVKSKFDVIMNYAAQQWTADLMFQVIDKIKAKKVFVPCGYSRLYDPEYKGYFRHLPEILRKYDAMVYLSRDYRDINFARKHHLKNIHIIPNGADEREFGKLNPAAAQDFRTKWGIQPGELLILNVSNHTGMKGHHEAIQAFWQANIKNAMLMFVGDVNEYGGCYRDCKRSSWVQNNVYNRLSNKNKRIVVTHISRKETLAAYQAADMFLFLSNLECSPLVLFEAAAAGNPFITSGCGNAAEIARWTGAGIVTKSRQEKDGRTTIDISAAAQAIEKLFGSEKMRIKMGKNGRKAWEKRYTWEILAKQYLKVYKG